MFSPIACAGVDPDGGHRGVLQAALGLADASPVLGIVLEVLGSAYAQAGSLCLFADGERRAGWLSGGCLENGLAREATRLVDAPRLLGIELDQRDDGSLMAPSSPGCRGRLRLALLPLTPLAGWQDPIRAWRDGDSALPMQVSSDGRVMLGGITHELPVAGFEWSDGAEAWPLSIPASPTVWLCGAGPEAAVLIPLLRSLGWRVAAIDSRARWAGNRDLADWPLDLPPEAAAVRLCRLPADSAVLVMHHDFERDRVALAALADSDCGWIGLLGPAARRNDLFRLLNAAQQDALRPRLHSPVGLDLGGKGPAHIALSIAAALTSWRHGGRD